MTKPLVGSLISIVLLTGAMAAQAQSDPPPTLDKCCPVAGVSGTTLKLGLVGKNFKADMKVFVDGAEATVNAVSPSVGQAIISSPAPSVGSHTISVSSSSGASTTGSTGGLQIRPEGALTFDEIVSTAVLFKQFTESTNLIFEAGVRKAIISKDDAFLAAFQRFDFTAAGNVLGALANYLNTLSPDKASAQYIGFAHAVVTTVLEPSVATFKEVTLQSETCKIEFKDIKVTIVNTGGTQYKMKVSGKVKVTPKEQNPAQVSAVAFFYKGGAGPGPAAAKTVKLDVGSTSVDTGGNFVAFETLEHTFTLPSDLGNPTEYPGVVSVSGITVMIVGTCKDGHSTSTSKAFSNPSTGGALTSGSGNVVEGTTPPQPEIHLSAKLALQHDKADTSKITGAVLTVSLSAKSLNDEAAAGSIQVAALAQLVNPSDSSDKTIARIHLSPDQSASGAFSPPGGSLEKTFTYDLVKLGNDNKVDLKTQVIVSTLQFKITGLVLGASTQAAAQQIDIEAPK